MWISSISSGLPLKVETKMVNFDSIKNEKAIRTIIKRSLAKEYPPHATVTSCQFISKILKDAYESGMHYDVTDLRPYILTFAAKSTHHASDCISMVNTMMFKSDEPSDYLEAQENVLIFFDCEVFPNLLLVCWKRAGEGEPIVALINPKPNEIEQLIRFKLVGFNNRGYDNHILYARMIGYDNKQIFELSKKLTSNEKDRQKTAKFGEAFNLSFTDVYDFSSKKQSLKKWEIELGIHHQELGLPWDKPVPEELWEKVAEYCKNDVAATEAVFNHLKEDWKARQILADLAGASVNDTTNALTTKIVFGNEKKPKLIYTDFATGFNSNGVKDEFGLNTFPGYEFKRLEDGKFHNMYRGTDVGMGGYVYAEPGIYENVALLDVASLHPSSIIALNKLGDYTQRYADLKAARVYIKHGDYDSVGKLFDGKFKKYLTSKDEAEALSKTLKLPLNSFYGISFGGYENPARDPRDKNNIIALRGALFMRTLQDEIESRGFHVVHIKTDSCKVPNATPELIDFIMDFGRKYGYEFEHECTYEKMCLVNDAVYIAKYDDKGIRNKGGKHPNEWTATGTQFQVPYVFKTLFSKEPIEFSDLCEVKSVKTAIYLDMNEDLPNVEEAEKNLAKLKKKYPDKDGLYPLDYDEVVKSYEEEIIKGHDYHFVGKVGQFCPMLPGSGGGILLRESDNGYSSVTGAKGYRWMESETVKILGKEKDIDKSYYVKLVDDAIESISQYGDFEEFAS